MTAPPPGITAAAIAALLLGGAVTVSATVLALRGRAGIVNLWWLGLAGVGQAMLGLAAAAQDPAGDGGRAATLQLLSVALAVLLGAACSTESPGEADGKGSLVFIGRAAAWFSLLGFPATVGFHSRVALLHSLLALDWTGFAILVMAGSAAAMWPALGALRSTPSSGGLRGWRRVAAITLLGAILLLGLYPGWGLQAAEKMARVALSG